MSSKSLTNLLQSEATRLKTEQLNENIKFLQAANEDDLMLGTTKYADAVIDALQNFSLYRNAYGNYKTRTYNELGIDPYVGSSKYDKYATNLYNLQHIADVRADYQSTGSKFLNGFIGALSNAAVTAATPATAFIGMIYDGATKQEFKFLNSSVMNQFQNFNDWVGQTLAPIYKHEWEQDESLSPFKRMTTAGFWAEDFIKNLGFTVGAMYGGKLIGMGTNYLFWNANTKKAAKALAKQLGSAEDVESIVQAVRSAKNLDQKALEISNTLAKKSRIKSVVNQVSGIVSGALIESHAEALQARRQMVDEGMRHIVDNYSPNSELVRLEYENALKNKEIPETMSFVQFMFKRRKELEDALNNRADQTMRAIFAAETALLSISNSVLWKNFFDLSVNKSASLLDNSILRFLTKPKTGTGLQDAKYRRNELSRVVTYLDSFVGEGLEEMFQSGISTAFENYYGSLMNDDYRIKKLAMNPKYSNAILRLFENTGFLQQFLSPQSLTEGLIGGITGAIGLPSKTMSRAQRQAQNISVFNPKAWTMQGGLWEAYRKNKDNTKQAKEVVANIQKTFSEGKTLNTILNDVIEIIAASHTEMGGYILNSKKEIFDSRRNQFLKALEIYEQFGMLGEVENYLKSLTDLNNIDDNERTNILINTFDLYKKKDGDTPTDADLEEIQKKIEETAKKEYKLINTYKKISDNLVQIANSSSNGMLTSMEKSIAASVVRNGLVRIEDIKERKSSILEKLLERYSSVFENLVLTTHPEEKNILDWLNNHFGDQLQQMLGLPLVAESGKISASDIKDDIILDIQKILKSYIEDVSQTSEIANNLVDLFLLNDDLSRQSNNVSKSWVSILTDIKEVEKQVEKENKKAENKKILDVVHLLNEKFDKLLNVKANKINQTETLKEIIPLLDQLREEDPDSYKEYFDEITTGSNNRAYHFMWEYINNEAKNKALQQESGLASYNTGENYKKVLDASPADLKKVLNEIINDPNIDLLEKKAWENFLARISNYKWFTRQEDMMRRFNSGVVKKTNNGEKVPVEKQPKDKDTETPEKAITSYDFIGTISNDNINLPDNEVKRIINQMKSFLTSLYQDLDHEVKLVNVSKDGKIKISFKKDDDINIDYIYDFKHNNVNISLTHKSKTKFASNIKFTDLWAISNQKRNDTLSNDNEEKSESLFNQKTFPCVRHLRNVQKGQNKDFWGASDDIINFMNDAYELFEKENKEGDSDAEQFAYFLLDSLLPTKWLRGCTGVLFHGIMLPETIAKTNNANTAEQVDKIVDKILTIYKNNLSELDDEEAENEEKEIEKSKPKEKSIAKKVDSTEIEYSEDEVNQLSLDQESLDLHLNDGETLESAISGLLAMNKIQDDTSDIENLGYEYDSETGVLSFKTDNFTSKSLIHAKGSFPIGYEFTFTDQKDNTQSLRVSKTNKNGKVEEAENDSYVLQKNKYGIYYLKHKKESQEDTDQKEYVAETQASLIPISEINYYAFDKGTGDIDIRHTKTWQQHNSLYEHLLETVFPTMYTYINTGKVKEGDEIIFRPESVSNLNEKDEKWLKNALKGTKFYKEPVIFLAFVRNSDPTDIPFLPIGFVLPETHGYPSMLWKEVLNSYDESTDTFNIKLKVSKVSNAHERAVTTNDPSKMITIDKYGYDELTFVLKTNSDHKPNVSNPDVTFSDEDVERMYGDTKSAGEWQMKHGQLYLIVRNSSGEIIPPDTSAPNCSVACSVKNDVDTFINVLNDFKVLSDVTNLNFEDITEDDIITLAHKLNNIFRFKNLNYKFFVQKTNEKKIRFSIYNEANSDLDAAVVGLKETSTGLQANASSVVWESSADPNKIIQQVAQKIVDFDGMIQLTENSFERLTPDDMKTTAGVDLQYLYEHGMLKVPIEHNRTTNTNIISDFQYEPESEKKKETKKKRNESQKITAKPKREVVIKPKVKKKTSILDNYKLKSTWSDHTIDVYENEDGVILYFPDYRTGVDFLKNNVEDIQNEFLKSGILVEDNGAITLAKPIHVYYENKKTKNIELAKNSDQYISLLQVNSETNAGSENEIDEEVTKNIPIEEVNDLEESVFSILTNMYKAYMGITSDIDVSFEEIENSLKEIDETELSDKELDKVQKMKDLVKALKQKNKIRLTNILNCLSKN